MSSPPLNVAVVGSGLAGLVTAHLLHNDSQGRYRVTLFEKDDRISLSSASVLLKDKQGELELVDVPMRSFASDYYRNLKSMYDHMRVQYRVQRYLYEFSKTKQQEDDADVDADSDRDDEPYYVHASNWHRLYTPQPEHVSYLQCIIQVVCLTVCYLYLTACCTFYPAKDDETFAAYLRRIHMPLFFTDRYLVPLISSVATCSHDQLLHFPARDFVEYRRQLFGAEHLSVTEGISNVQRRLAKGLDVRLKTDVDSVKPAENGVSVRWRTRTRTSSSSEEDSAADVEETQVFDHVVLAVPPNATAKMFPQVKHVMSRIPTTTVSSAVLQPSKSKKGSTLSVVDPDSSEAEMHIGQAACSTQLIALKTDFGNDDDVRTTAFQELDNGARVYIGEAPMADSEDLITRASFTRVLRTVESRHVVNALFSKDPHDGDEWKNGDNGVWLAGSWCWDGMVLLEGCVVSAMRIATAFNVDIPWARS